MTGEANNAFVVAVAGPPGCGKSSLLTGCAAALGQASVLEFDEFETLTTASVEELVSVQSQGAGFENLDVPGLAEALTSLRRGEAIQLPSGRHVAAAPLVLFEMPLGRAYPPTRSLIDRLVWIDVAADVALARALIALCASESKPPHAWLVGYLENYIRFTRSLLAHQREVVAPDADMTLDGSAPLSQLAHALVDYIRGQQRRMGVA